MSNYQPSEPGKKGSIFGLPYTLEDAEIILLPVHLDVTASYREGTALAPDLIIEESTQLDLGIPDIKEPWKLKIACDENQVDKTEHCEARKKAKSVIYSLENDKITDKNEIDAVNTFCEKTHRKVEQKVSRYLSQNKKVGILGGEHAVALGIISSLAKRQSFGILQLDAHMDLRNSYEGFEYSHASIMYNALKLPNILSLTQVGIRDFCDEEINFIKRSKQPISVFYDEKMYSRMTENHTGWKDIVSEILASLPNDIYVSFDMDVLDPSLCTHTGTPVPGGLSYNQVIYLFNSIVKAKKKIIGFDVSETGNHTYDANFASRILYRLCVCMGQSNKMI